MAKGHLPFTPLYSPASFTPGQTQIHLIHKYSV